MTDLTKEEFKMIVEQMVNELTSLSDNLWNSTFPSARISLSNDQTIFVGIEETKDENDDDTYTKVHRERDEARAALEEQTEARKLAQGWCNVHGVYHRNYRCDYGFGI